MKSYSIKSKIFTAINGRFLFCTIVRITFVVCCQTVVTLPHSVTILIGINFERTYSFLSNLETLALRNCSRVKMLWGCVWHKAHCLLFIYALYWKLLYATCCVPNHPTQYNRLYHCGTVCWTEWLKINWCDITSYLHLYFVISRRPSIELAARIHCATIDECNWSFYTTINITM